MELVYCNHLSDGDKIDSENLHMRKELKRKMPQNIKTNKIIVPEDDDMDSKGLKRIKNQEEKIRIIVYKCPYCEEINRYKGYVGFHKDGSKIYAVKQKKNGDWVQSRHNINEEEVKNNPYIAQSHADI